MLPSGPVVLEKETLVDLSKEGSDLLIIQIIRRPCQKQDPWLHSK